MPSVRGVLNTLDPQMCLGSINTRCVRSIQMMMMSNVSFRTIQAKKKS